MRTKPSGAPENEHADRFDIGGPGAPDPRRGDPPPLPADAQCVTGRGRYACDDGQGSICDACLSSDDAPGREHAYLVDMPERPSTEELLRRGTGIRHADTAFAIAKWATKGRISSAGYAVQDLIDNLIELGWTPPASDNERTEDGGSA